MKIRAVLVTLIAAAGSLSMGHAASGWTPGAFRSLNDAVAGAKLERGVVREMREKGVAQGFVVFENKDILSAALTSVPRGGGKTAAILAVTKPAYAALKEALAWKVGRGMNVLREYRALAVSYVRFRSPEALLAASNEPRVRAIVGSRRHQQDMAQSLPLIKQPDAVAEGYEGAGTAVAVLDTGADYTHADLGGCTAPAPGSDSYTPTGSTCRVAYARDFAPEDEELDADIDNHGTNVASVVAKTAPKTKILALDVNDGEGVETGDEVAALNWVVDNQAMYNIRAINMSFGSGHNTQVCSGSAVEKSALDEARGLGIVAVASSGNEAMTEGPFQVGIHEPGCISGVISVGAVYDTNVDPIPSSKFGCTDSTTAADMIPCFSQTASILSVLAPGSKITAGGVTFSGTSQAAPHVAGAVAILAVAVPSATPAQITTAITSTGPSITDARSGANNVSKHRLDVNAAIASFPEHDVAVSLSVPAEVLQGASLSVSATVQNRGRRSETFSLYFSDAPPGSRSTVMRTVAVSGLAPGESRQIPANWTPPAPRGLHSVRASASLPGDGATSNNSASGSVQVRSSVLLAQLHAGAGGEASEGSGWIRAMVTVTDQDGRAISDVAADQQWTWPKGEEFLTRKWTGADGRTTWGPINGVGDGEYVFTLVSLSKSGYSWGQAEASVSVTVPY